MPQVDLRWCCDLNEASLQRICRQLPATRTTTRLDEVLGDPAVDAIVIATAAPTHHEVARRALLSGKDVLVEKPMTLTTSHARDLVELARRSKRVLMVGHLLEYHPAIRQIKKMIDGGELGTIYYIYSQRLNLGTVRSDENAWWSLAPHDISVACRLLGGTPIAVQCRGQNIVQPKIADVVFATIEVPGRRIAHIHVSWLDPHKTRKLTVVGSRKMVVLDDTLASYKLTIYDKGFELRQEFATYADWISMRQGDILVPKHDTSEPLVLEAQHFVDCVRTRQRPLSDGEAWAQVVAVLESGQQSLDLGGQVVAVGLVGHDRPRRGLTGFSLIRIGKEGLSMKIAIFSNNDSVWLLPTWTASLKLLSEKHDLAGIWLFPDTLGHRRGLEVPYWYLEPIPKPLLHGV